MGSPPCAVTVCQEDLALRSVAAAVLAAASEQFSAAHKQRRCQRSSQRERLEVIPERQRDQVGVAFRLRKSGLREELLGLGAILRGRHLNSDTGLDRSTCLQRPSSISGRCPPCRFSAGHQVVHHPIIGGILSLGVIDMQQDHVRTFVSGQVRHSYASPWVWSPHHFPIEIGVDQFVVCPFLSTSHPMR